MAILPSRQTNGFSSHDLEPVYTASIRQRVQRFVAGLHPSIQAIMAREVEMGTDYQLVVEIARRIEGYRQRGREKMQHDKRTRFSGEFRGAPCHAREFIPSTSHSSPSSGYSGHQGQTQGQQSMAPKGCYECGDPDHMKRFCPRLWGKAVHQGHQPMITAPAVRLPRGGGQAGRGCPRGGGQAEGGKANVVADALSKKAKSMDSLIKARQLDDPNLAVLRETDLRQVHLATSPTRRLDSPA
nr:uncharacterized protein LOC117278360 [Nicotiana tomentosiformis]